MGAEPRRPAGTFRYLIDLGRRVLDLDTRKPPRRSPPSRGPAVRAADPVPPDRVIDLNAPPDRDAQELADLHAKLDEATAIADRAAEERDRVENDRDDVRLDLNRALRRVDELVQERSAAKGDLAAAAAQLAGAQAERDAVRIESLNLRARIDHLEVALTTTQIRLGQLEVRFAHRRRFRRGRRLRRLGATLLLVGIFVGLFGVYETVWTSAVTRHEQTELRVAFHRESAGAQTVATSSPAARRAAANPRKGSVVGRLRIRAIGLDVMVVQGVGRDQLAKGPGVYPQTVPFGALGSTAIAGHRTGWGSPFRRLDSVERGDRIVVETRSRTYTYRVSRLVVSTPDDGWVLAGDPDSTAPRKLALTTCTPPFTASYRLIVWADLVAEAPRGR